MRCVLCRARASRALCGEVQCRCGAVTAVLCHALLCGLMGRDGGGDGGGATLPRPACAVLRSRGVTWSSKEASCAPGPPTKSAAEAMCRCRAVEQTAKRRVLPTTGKTRARGSGQRVEGVPGARGESPRFRGFVRSVAILRRSETGPAQTLVAGAPSKACRAEARDHRGPTRQNKSGPWRDQTARVAISPPSRPGGV